MSKRGMRAAGVCLATVAVMSGSVAADGAVTSPDSALKLAADDFTIRFSATPTRVVLSPDGGKTAAEYRIVVRQPRRVDQVESVTLSLERGRGRRFNQFRMTGGVVSEPSATKTVLSGHTGFHASYRERWTHESKRANPGIYTSVRARIAVTSNGEVTYLSMDPPTGRIHVLYATKTVLDKRSVRADRVRLEGRALGYNGSLYAENTREQWSGLSDTRLKVLFLRRGDTEPRVVGTPNTDSDGRFTVRSPAHHSGRWWIRFPGDRLLDASRSTGYSVDMW